MLSVLLVVAVAAGPLSFEPFDHAHAAVWRCPPCDLPCDQQRHEAEGACPDCGMTLVDGSPTTSEVRIAADGTARTGQVERPWGDGPFAAVVLVGTGGGRIEPLRAALVDADVAVLVPSEAPASAGDLRSAAAALAALPGLRSIGLVFVGAPPAGIATSGPGIAFAVSVDGSTVSAIGAAEGEAEAARKQVIDALEKAVGAGRR